MFVLSKFSCHDITDWGTVASIHSTEESAMKAALEHVYWENNDDDYNMIGDILTCGLMKYITPEEIFADLDVVASDTDPHMNYIITYKGEDCFDVFGNFILSLFEEPDFSFMDCDYGCYHFCTITKIDSIME